VLQTALAAAALLDLRGEATYNRDNVAGLSWHHQRLAGI